MKSQNTSTALNNKTSNEQRRSDVFGCRLKTGSDDDGMVIQTDLQRLQKRGRSTYKWSK